MEEGSGGEQDGIEVLVSGQSIQEVSYTASGHSSLHIIMSTYNVHAHSQLTLSTQTYWGH